MVLKKVEVERKICDVPGCKEVAVHTCIGCRRDFCSEHGKKEGRQMVSAIMARNASDDGFICHKCYDNRIELDEIATKLLIAYVAVEKLDKDYDDYFDRVTKKNDKLKKEIAEYRKEWKNQKV